jgi:hypothetical protein
VVALIAGEPVRSAQIAQHLPPAFRIARDPEASASAAMLNLDRTPFVIEFQRGRVTAKTMVHSASDLERLFDGGRKAAARSGTAEVAQHAN